MEKSLAAILIILACCNASFLVEEEDPYVELPGGDDDFFQKRCSSNGFQFQRHSVTTKDGYILSLFRIPALEGAETNSKPLLVQHGIFDSADAWIVNDPKVASAFQLVRAGYDVWLGNCRGNKYSHAHTTLDPKKDDGEFFNYSFEDMGAYDLPANIEYVLNQTGASRISYVGHSQGTTQFFYSMAKDNAWLAKRVKVFAALGPVVRIDHCTSELLQIGSLRPQILDLPKKIGVNELFPANWVVTGTMTVLCGTLPQICNLGMKLISDDMPSLNNQKSTKLYFRRFPSGSSVKTLAHYAQEIHNHFFEEFDYGEEQNLRQYGQSWPPILDLTITNDIPVGLFVGDGDKLATVKDNHWLKGQLHNNLKFYKEYHMGHLSFMIGQDSSYVQDLITFLDNY